MKTQPNDPMIPVQEQDEINHQNWHTTAGLTKREHMAIEFTKAIISNGCEFTNERIVYEALLITDELIKQLNAEQP